MPTFGRTCGSQEATCPQRRENKPLAKRLQRLEVQARKIQERRLEPPRAPRPSMHCGSQEHNGLVHTFAKRHHQHHHQPQHFFDFVKLPSLSGSNDPTLYLE